MKIKHWYLKACYLYRSIVLSKKDSYSKIGLLKCFIGYINKTNAFPVSLCIKILQMNEYVKCFDSNNNEF